MIRETFFDRFNQEWDLMDMINLKIFLVTYGVVVGLGVARDCSLGLRIVHWSFELFAGPLNCSLGLCIVHWAFELFTGPLHCSLGL